MTAVHAGGFLKAWGKNCCSMLKAEGVTVDERRLGGRKEIHLPDVREEKLLRSMKGILFQSESAI